MVITAFVVEDFVDVALVARVVLVADVASVAHAIVAFRDPEASVAVAGVSDAVAGAPSNLAIEISGAGT